MVTFSHSSTYSGGTVEEKLTHSVSITDAPFNARSGTECTAAIQAAIDFVGSNGGGIVYFPAGTYLVTAATGTQALSLPYSNVTLRGDGPGASILKCQANTGIYGILAMQFLPLQNGVPAIFNSQVRDLQFDGNFDGVGDASSLIHASGTYDCAFDNLYMHSTPGYCIGLQNGGHVGTRITNSVFEGSSHDAIDVKNNEKIAGGSVGKSLVFQNLVFRNCCRGSNATDGYAVLDVMSPGVIIDNIHIESFSEDVGVAATQAGIRLKPGMDVGSSRGVGAHYALISNIYVTKQSAARSVQTAIDVICPWAQIKNVQIVGDLDSGIRLSQSYCEIDGGTIAGTTDGILVRQIIGTDPSIQPYAGGDNCVITGVNFFSNANGINNSRADLRVTHCQFGPTVATGIKCAGANSSRMTATFNTFATGVVTPVSIDLDRNHTIAENRGAPNMLSKVLTSGLTDHRFLIGGTFRFATGYDGFNPSNALDQVRISNTANAVNAVDLRGSATGGAVIVTAAGTDTNIPVRIQGAGSTGTAQLGASSNRIGFFANGGAAKQTVSGAKGGNTALASLLTALAAYGLITDGSTA